MTLDELNALPVQAAERELLACCGSTRWASAMATRRPFPDAAAVYRAAEEVWTSLEGADWLEAFARHPRIGERSTGWAQGEQSATRDASPETLNRLAQLNHEYERKFGHVFLISATGKSAHEMLDTLRHRMSSNPASELRVAAAEQGKITRLRLEKLLSVPRDPAIAP